MDLARIQDTAVLAQLTESSASPVLSRYVDTLLRLHGTITEVLEATGSSWTSGGAEIDEDTDEVRRTDFALGKGRIELCQERRAGDGVPVVSEMTVDTDASRGEFKYLLVVHPSEPSKSSVCQSYEEGQERVPGNRGAWSLTEEDMLLNPTLMQRAVGLAEHMTAVLKAALTTGSLGIVRELKLEE